MKVLKNERMSQHTTFRAGGPAKVYVIPEDDTELQKLIGFLYAERLPYMVIGNGSNLLVSDRGLPLVVVEVLRGLRGITVPEEKDGRWHFTAMAGELLSKTAMHAAAYGLTGMEGLQGIPGTVGGAAVMNAGAYGAEMKDVLSRVTVITREGERLTLPAEALDLSYRHSCIAERGYTVVSAEFALEKGDPGQIQAAMDDYRQRRIDKQPLDRPSAGSTFKRPEGHFAGKLIEDSGLRGYRKGSACVSEKHCGFIVSDGSGRAQDIYDLITAVRDIVFEKQGIRLEPEVCILGEF